MRIQTSGERARAADGSASSAGAPSIPGAPDIPDAESLTPSAARILEVASALFYERGIHAVGVDTIAAESGVTKRTLYNNFRAKDVLIAAYLKNRHRTWWAYLEQRIAEAPAPRALVLFDVYERDTLTATRGCAFLNAAAELPDDHPGYAIVRLHKNSVERRILELIREDAIGHPDPERLARHLFLLLEGTFAHTGVQGPGLLREAREIAHEMLSAPVSGEQPAG
ncbi:TetR/AcrR family transcriptional regulator [Brevibacterium album]|uniref:TetR/AcrR family transcriptional regulator n=1 Tax=Brevibacterium album TaxID=417948 RepID=UPI0004073EF9|nr:TetR/AcrR family transcriptional regulator [Brevibacterium album]